MGSKSKDVVSNIDLKMGKSESIRLRGQGHFISYHSQELGVLIGHRNSRRA